MRIPLLPLFLVALLLTFAWPPTTLAAAPYYSQSIFNVRKVNGICKLEITLPPKFRTSSSSSNKKGQELAILGIFPSNRYYGEIFTSKNTIGAIQGGLDIAFDNSRESIDMLEDDQSSDKFWRWRYFSYNNSFLSQFKRAYAMRVSFKSGNNRYTYRIPLKGSSKALSMLHQCSRKK